MKEFSEIVGQEKVKKQISFYIEAFKVNRVLPHLLFSGPKGMGKTEFMRATCVALGKKRKLINCASLPQKIEEFFEQIVIPHIKDEEVSIAFDEVHAMPEKIQILLLNAINPNKENRNTLEFGEYVVDIDFKKVTFLFGTTNPELVLEPFKDRCKIIQLEDYSLEDLSKIILKNTENIKFDDKSILYAASVGRGNGRNAVNIAKDILQYCALKRKNSFFRKDWVEFSKTLNVNPLGLLEGEIQVLKALSGGPLSLTALSSRTGFERTALQKDVESYLLKRGMVSIQGARGRVLTQKGHKYLDNINDWDYFLKNC